MDTRKNTSIIISFKRFFFHSDRTKSKGGGVAMLIHKCFIVRERPDFQLPFNLCESLFLEIILRNHKKLIVGILYRDQNTSVHKFNEELNDCLLKLANVNKYVYIMGDMNINLLNCSSIQYVQDFVNVLYNSFRPLINKPTRIINSSVSLIDNY